MSAHALARVSSRYANEYTDTKQWNNDGEALHSKVADTLIHRFLEGLATS